jgi:DNA-binding LacI/PurR family transcriptional regulator
MYIYEKIRDELIEKIGSLPPHERIPSRNALCREYLVTRTTIDRAIDELANSGYLYSVMGSGTFVADLSANGMKLGAGDKNFGVLLPDITADTYPEILRGIQDTADRYGISIVACNTDNQTEKQASIVRRLINSKVDGLIIIPAISSSADQAFCHLLEDSSVPFVFCNRNIGGVNSPCVCSNDFYGSFLATTHLIEQGYRRIAYLSAMFYKTSMDRYQGYIAALSQHEREIDESLILIGETTDPSRQEGAGQLLKALLQKDGSVDAVVCFNDRVACDAMEAVQGIGLRVSEDIGLIGYDNTSVCNLLPIKLTSMDYRNYEIGQCAATTLYRMISEPGFAARRITTFEPRIVVRDSCRGAISKTVWAQA